MSLRVRCRLHQGIFLSFLLLPACFLDLASSQALRFGPATVCPDFSQYTALHWQATFGTAPGGARWLVTQNDQGLADRIVDVVSSFLIALIQKRAFCIMPVQHFHQTGFEEAYDSPFIDWTCQHPGGNTTGQPAYLWEGLPAEDRVETSLMRWGGLSGVSQATNEAHKAFIASDLRNMPENKYRVWKMTIGKGLSVGLFSNRYHDQELRQLGLRPDTAFGCILSYLFRPRRELFWLVPRPLLNTMTNNEVMKIGIQIRIGDQSIQSGGGMSDAEFKRVAMPFFDCALSLEKEIAAYTGAKSIKWFLMTDTKNIRIKAKEMFGDKLLMLHAMAIKHSSHEISGQSIEDSKSSFRGTVMEYWLLQQAHYHIITMGSGLGRTAAFASLRENNVFTMILGQGRIFDRKCRLSDHDKVTDVFNHWSGI